MSEPEKIPQDPIGFIKGCIDQRQIYWTYHVNMRIGQRSITRDLILNAVESFEVIEEYPEDKYLPSYLIRAESEQSVFHVLFAADVAGDNVRVVTAYFPDPQEWEADFRARRK